MKIQICGSMTFAKEMLETKQLLENAGHTAWVPCDAEYHVESPGLNNDLQTDLQHCLETDVMRKCYDAIAISDAVLVLNYQKNGLDGYIGVSTLMEMSLAYYFRKKIYILFPIPEPQQARWSHEVQVFQPIFLNGSMAELLQK